MIFERATNNKKKHYFRKRFTFAKNIIAYIVINFIVLRKTFIYGVVCVGLICLCDIVLGQQKITKSVINKYINVSSITGSEVVVGSTTGFGVGDTVLLIQMTGISADGNNPNNAGKYEFYIVRGVNSTQNRITLSANPSGYVPATEFVQLVRVPSYRNAELVSGTKLECDLWNEATGTGGVLALMVEETLTLNDNIDVSALGFPGGGASGTPFPTVCNSTSYTSADYPASASDMAGYKGHGALVKSILTSAPRGKGPVLSNRPVRISGGGGGNGMYSGGGGGGNGGAGGRGGVQVCEQPSTPDENGGAAVKYNSGGLWVQRAFMGGGGGSGTGYNTDGGKGGGIVIIVAGKLRLNGDAIIKANGESVTASTSITEPGGAGGGGAAGSILISVGNSTADYGNFKAEIVGGTGGDVMAAGCNGGSGSLGAGGGGGGGLVYASMDKNTFVAAFGNTIKRSEDNNGKINGGGCGSQSIPGEEGFILGALELPLKGFLYNFITTADTTLCYNDTKTLKASTPKGGNGSYTYLWQYSLNGTTGWTSCSGINNTPNYTGAFTVDGYYRRTVTSSDGSTPITDNSSSIRVTIIPQVTNTLIFPADTTLCGNVKSISVIKGSVPTGGDGANYAYRWEQNINNGGWTEIPGARGGVKDLTDIPLVSDASNRTEQDYRRKVTSIGCTTESNIAKIYILPIIKGNDLGSDRQLCEIDQAVMLGNTVISGGDNTHYGYMWQESGNNKNWSVISGETSLTYTPPKDIGDRWYRRVISSGSAVSGSYDCCADTARSVLVRYDQLPSPAFAGADQTQQFKFNAAIDATPATSGEGLWTAEGNITFADPRQPSTEASNLEIGVNTLQWTVSSGACPVNSDQMTIEVSDINLYSGFSPDGDGINDCFIVGGAENAESAELIIFNRYNNEVYRSNSFKNNGTGNDCTGWWDGRNTAGKELPSGTYFYQLTLNGNKVYKGYVVLKR